MMPQVGHRGRLTCVVSPPEERNVVLFENRAPEFWHPEAEFANHACMVSTTLPTLSHPASALDAFGLRLTARGLDDTDRPLE
jgi:hypothetical protein